VLPLLPTCTASHSVLPLHCLLRSWELVGVNSVVFLEARDKEGPSPTALVQHVCQQAAQTKVCAAWGAAGHGAACLPGLVVVWRLCVVWLLCLVR